MSQSSFKPLRDQPKGKEIHAALSALERGVVRPGGWTDSEKRELAALFEKMAGVIEEWKGEWRSRGEV